MAAPNDFNDNVLYDEEDVFVTKDSSVRVLNNKRLSLFGSVWLNGLPLSANEGGGGQVLSVNGEIGDVQLDAVDIPVSPSGTVQSSVTNLNNQVVNKAEKGVVIGTTAPLTGGGDLSSSRQLDISTFTSVTKGAVPPPISVIGKYLKDNGTWDSPAAGGITDGNKGDITVSGTGTLWVVNDGAVTKTEVGLSNVDNTSDINKPVSTAQQSALNSKVDSTRSLTTTAPLTGGGDLSVNRTLDINNFSTNVKGAVPAPVTVTGKFLRDDGSWQNAGTQVVPVAYNSWPPASPQPNTLYLRLAP